MKDIEISKLFNLNINTVYNWRKGKDKGRKLLYEIIKNLPNEYIESVKKKIEEEEKLKESLKKDE